MTFFYLHFLESKRLNNCMISLQKCVLLFSLDIKCMDLNTFFNTVPCFYGQQVIGHHDIDCVKWGSSSLCEFQQSATY